MPTIQAIDLDVAVTHLLSDSGLPTADLGNGACIEFLGAHWEAGLAILSVSGVSLLKRTGKRGNAFLSSFREKLRTLRPSSGV